MPNQIQNLVPKWRAKFLELSKQFQGFSLFVSGGLDSTTLAVVFCRLLKIQNISDTELIHLNFMLRGAESDEDAEFVKTLGLELGVRVRVIEARSVIPGPPIGRSAQVWARNVRQVLMRDAQQQNRCVLTAHHANDVVETIIFRLARGASAGRVVGMKPQGKAIWRPFLGLARHDIENIAQAESVTHREDSSNAKMAYSRNRIRHELVPALNRMFPGVEERMLACFSDAKDIEDDFRSRLESERSLNTDQSGVDQSWLTGFAKGTAIMIIGDMIKEAAGRPLQLRRHHLETIFEHIRSDKHRWSMHLPANLMWISERGRGSVTPRPKPE